MLIQIATRLNQRSGPHGADLALISILDLVESALGAEVQFLRYHNSRDELERLLVDRYSDQLRTHADKT